MIRFLIFSIALIGLLVSVSSTPKNVDSHPSACEVQALVIDIDSLPEFESLCTVTEGGEPFGGPSTSDRNYRSGQGAQAGHRHPAVVDPRN